MMSFSQGENLKHPPDGSKQNVRHTISKGDNPFWGTASYKPISVLTNTSVLFNDSIFDFGIWVWCSIRKIKGHILFSGKCLNVIKNQILNLFLASLLFLPGCGAGFWFPGDPKRPLIPTTTTTWGSLFQGHTQFPKTPQTRAITHGGWVEDEILYDQHF